MFWGGHALIPISRNHVMSEEKKCNECCAPIATGFEFTCKDCGNTFCGRNMCVGHSCTCGAKSCATCWFDVEKCTACGDSKFE